MKKYAIYILIISIIFLGTIIYFLNINTLPYIDIDSHEKIKNEMYEYVKMFDKNIFESLQIYDNDNKKISDEQIVDICVKYIISNKDEFKGKIYHLDEGYNVEDNGTIYYSLGYVEVETLNNVILKLFSKNNVDLSNNIYYNNSRKLIALLAMYGDYFPYDKSKIVDFNEIDYYNYDLTVEYYKEDIYSFRITYQIERNTFNENGKYSLVAIKLK